MATSAALAVLNLLEDQDLQSNAHKRGAQLMSGLDHVAHDIPEILEVRGKGLMLGLELADPETGRPDPVRTSRILEEAKAEGLLIGKGGLYGNVIRIAPPLSVTEEECEEGLVMLETAIGRATGS